MSVEERRELYLFHILFNILLVAFYFSQRHIRVPTVWRAPNQTVNRVACGALGTSRSGPMRECHELLPHPPRRVSGHGQTSSLRNRDGHESIIIIWFVCCQIQIKNKSSINKHMVGLACFEKNWRKKPHELSCGIWPKLKMRNNWCTRDNTNPPTPCVPPWVDFLERRPCFYEKILSLF